ncbi:PEP-CTERM sorting domain-containing protein [Aquisphaera insulae]|uniref:PEP-CTERM sorting domain-containing protein n=1 Tax=Aquisphaera insulae TaxID=2712864 RepID=UPI0013EC1650|nr:PEP-CTERM sorting domain-containing protein [Aquisphaera insulae]
MSARRFVLGLILAWCVTPAQAGQITYEFVQGSDGPHPGEVAAALIFAEPPAFPDAGWKTSDVASILQFSVLDADFAQLGTYTPQLVQEIRSETGSILIGGQITGLANGVAIHTLMDLDSGQSLLVNLVTGKGIHGDWIAVVQAPGAVPEPSTLAMAGIGVVACLAARALARHGRRAAARSLTTN